MAKRVVAIRLEPKQHAALKRLAKAAKVTVNYLIERCLDSGIEEVKSELELVAEHGKGGAS